MAPTNSPRRHVVFRSGGRLDLGGNPRRSSAMDPLFRSSDTFSSLSIKDLVEARDLFHYHLMNTTNEPATAIGLYRIRIDDPWPDKEHPRTLKPRQARSNARTLSNSEV